MRVDPTAEAIDGRIEQAMGLIAEFARADRVTVGQLQEGGRTFSRTHQWVREGFQRIEGEEPVKPYPWASRRVFVDREPLVLSRLDDLPPEAARDRQSFERLGVKSVATFPLVVGKSAVVSGSASMMKRGAMPDDSTLTAFSPW